MSTRPIIICETPSGCTCGAPADTPAGMHHCDCAVHPGWCGASSCLPCQRNGHTTPDPAARSHPDAQTAQIAEESHE